MSYLEFSQRWNFEIFERFLQGYHAFKPGLGIIGNEHMANYHFCPQDAPDLGFDLKLPGGGLKEFSARTYRGLAKNITHDWDAMMVSVNIIPNALRYASRDLRGDKELVLAAVNKDPFALKHAVEKVHGEFDVVYSAIQKEPFIFTMISERYREQYQDNEEIMWAAVETDPHAIRFASKRLLDDPELVRFAVERSPDVLRHASKRIQNDISLNSVFDGLAIAEEDQRSALDDCILQAESLKSEFSDIREKRDLGERF